MNPRVSPKKGIPIPSPGKNGVVGSKARSIPGYIKEQPSTLNYDPGALDLVPPVCMTSTRSGTTRPPLDVASARPDSVTSQDNSVTSCLDSDVRQLKADQRLRLDIADSDEQSGGRGVMRSGSFHSPDLNNRTPVSDVINRTFYHPRDTVTSPECRNIGDSLISLSGFSPLPTPSDVTSVFNTSSMTSRSPLNPLVTSSATYHKSSLSNTSTATLHKTSLTSPSLNKTSLTSPSLKQSASPGRKDSHSALSVHFADKAGEHSPLRHKAEPRSVGYFRSQSESGTGPSRPAPHLAAQHSHSMLFHTAALGDKGQGSYFSPDMTETALSDLWLQTQPSPQRSSAKADLKLKLLHKEMLQTASRHLETLSDSPTSSKFGSISSFASLSPNRSGRVSSRRDARHTSANIPDHPASSTFSPAHKRLIDQLTCEQLRQASGGSSSGVGSMDPHSLTPSSSVSSSSSLSKELTPPSLRDLTTSASPTLYSGHSTRSSSHKSASTPRLQQSPPPSSLPANSFQSTPSKTPSRSTSSSSSCFRSDCSADGRDYVTSSSPSHHEPPALHHQDPFPTRLDFTALARHGLKLPSELAERVGQYPALSPEEDMTSLLKKESIAASYQLEYCWFCGRPMPLFGGNRQVEINFNLFFFTLVTFFTQLSPLVAFLLFLLFLFIYLKLNIQCIMP